MTMMRINRRAMLGAGVAGASMLAMPALLRAQDKSLKVGVYGGYFKDSFDKNIFPEFTKATGIAVESIAEPTGEAWLVQLEQAARANQAPADVSMMSQVAMLKGQSTDLWTPIDMAKIKNADSLLDRFINKYPDGRVAGVGAVSWYITLVTNTDAYKEAPTSWQAFWDPANADKLGLLALVSNSFLLDVTAKTFFGGPSALDIDAAPMLVSLRNPKMPARLLPSPDVFDHVFARVESKDWSRLLEALQGKPDTVDWMN